MQTATRVPIDVVEMDASGGLFVRPRIPSSEGYEQIYRSATGVRWHRDLRALVPYEVRGMPASWWFRQIIDAVRSEYGHHLELSPETRWNNVPEEQRRQIEEMNKHAA